VSWCVCSDPVNLGHALSTLGLCTTLKSLSISISGPQATLLEPDITPLSQLHSLEQLSIIVALPGPQPLLRPVALSPLHSLAQLKQLTVQGLVPAAELGPDLLPLVDRLPPSLVSITLQHVQQGPFSLPGGGIVALWSPTLRAATQLQQLHLVNPADVELACNGLQQLQHLRELHLRYPSTTNAKFYGLHDLPESVAELTNLEVLRISTDGADYPWEQHWCSGLCVGHMLLSLPKLRELGAMLDFPSHWEEMANVELRQLTRLTMDIDEELPSWLVEGGCPQLQHLQLSAACITQSILQGAAELNQLTCLRLDTGWSSAVGNGSSQGWCELSCLGAALPKLQRLELVNCYSYADGKGAVLVVPGLSCLRQVRELQLVCAMDPSRPPLQQPSGEELLHRLSELTQLTQLELLGFSAVTSGVVRLLVEGLPRVGEVRVGGCRHAWEKEAGSTGGEQAEDGGGS
jgi:hypothetical protein